MPYTKSFLNLRKVVKKQYLGKPVPPRLQNKYGKRYGPKDVKGITYAIAIVSKVKIDKRLR